MTVTYEPVPGCLAAEVGDSTVILVPNSSMDFVELDEVGRAIWETLTEHGTVASIASALLDRYDVEIAELEADVADYLERLARMGMVSRIHD
jgi:hypothetical protein